nr:hypothetical protein [Streptomyces tsukubensis NRRL18488]
MAEDLDVDGPAVEYGGGEGRAGAFAVEELEAALGVPQPGYGDGLYQQVSGPAEPLAAAPLVDVDPGVGVGAGADDRGRVPVGEQGVEVVELLDGGGQIGVGDEDPAAVRGEDALAQGVALAVVLGAGDDMDAGVVGGGFAGDGGGVVGGAVVDDDQLPGAPAAGVGVEVVADGVEGGQQAFGLVVGGDDDAEPDPAVGDAPAPGGLRLAGGGGVGVGIAGLAS